MNRYRKLWNFLFIHILQDRIHAVVAVPGYEPLYYGFDQITIGLDGIE